MMGQESNHATFKKILTMNQTMQRFQKNPYHELRMMGQESGGRETSNTSNVFTPGIKSCSSSGCFFTMN